MRSIGKNVKYSKDWRPDVSHVSGLVKGRSTLLQNLMQGYKASQLLSDKLQFKLKHLLDAIVQSSKTPNQWKVIFQHYTGTGQLCWDKKTRRQSVLFFPPLLPFLEGNPNGKSYSLSPLAPPELTDTRPPTSPVKGDEAGWACCVSLSLYVFVVTKYLVWIIPKQTVFHKFGCVFPSFQWSTLVFINFITEINLNLLGVCNQPRWTSGLLLFVFKLNHHHHHEVMRVTAFKSITRLLIGFHIVLKWTEFIRCLEG